MLIQKNLTRMIKPNMFIRNDIWIKSISSQVKNQQSSLEPCQEITSFMNHFVGCLMRSGQKQKTLRFVNSILSTIHQKTLNKSQDPRSLLMEAIDKASPLVKNNKATKRRRHLLVPVPLLQRQRRRVVIMWLRDMIKGKKKGGVLIGNEIIEVLNGKSQILEKREQMHKSCLAKRSNIIMRDQPVAFKV